MPEFRRPSASDMANMRAVTLPADNNTWALVWWQAAREPHDADVRDA
jgi:hypothetical protein